MDVEAILATSAVKHKSTEVNKEVELQFDLRNLLATDLNSLDTEALRYKVILKIKNYVYLYMNVMHEKYGAGLIGELKMSI
jgi:hypothetical protein